MHPIADIVPVHYLVFESIVEQAFEMHGTSAPVKLAEHINNATVDAILVTESYAAKNDLERMMKWPQKISTLDIERVHEFACMSYAQEWQTILITQQHTPVDDEPESFLESALEAVVAAGNLVLAEVLMNMIPTPDRRLHMARFIFLIAAVHERLAIVEWLYEKYGMALNLDGDIGKYAVEQAVMRGNLEMLKWLHANTELTQARMQKGFYWAANSGRIRLMNWFKTTFGAQLDLRYNNHEAFRAGSQKPDVSVMQWFLDNDPGGITMKDVQEAFNYATYLGHITVMQWMYDKWPTVNVAEALVHAKLGMTDSVPSDMRKQRAEGLAWLEQQQQQQHV